MIPEIHLGPVTLQTFGLSFALAFVVAGWIVAKRLRELGWPVYWAYEFILAGAVGGILGAKIWYSVQRGDWAANHIFSGSGLVWYGGVLGGAAAVALYANWRGILSLKMLDMCAPSLAAGYAVGRIGCQLSGDGDYGKVTNAWWGMGYPNGTVPTPPGVHVYPTPVLETLIMAILAYSLWRLRDRWRPGVLFGVYLVASSIERLAIEFIRRNDVVTAGLTLPQLVSIGLGAAGLGMILALSNRPIRTDDETSSFSASV